MTLFCFVALSLLDKMKNRGFPPEEHHNEKNHQEKDLPHKGHTHLHFNEAVGKVIRLNSVIKRISEVRFEDTTTSKEQSDQKSPPMRTQPLGLRKSSRK